MTQVCNGCGIEKPLKDYYKSKQVKSGYRATCKECMRLYEAKKREIPEKREEHNKLSRDWNKNNKERKTANDKAWKTANPDKVIATRRRYIKSHPGKHRKRRASDLNFKLAMNLRTRLYCAVRSDQKAGSAVDDLGISILEFRDYLSSLFYSNPETNEPMTWDNYGRWHIDHKVPLAEFDLTNREQFLKAAHYTNLQPLWAKHNLSKSDKLDWKRA